MKSINFRNRVSSLFQKRSMTIATSVLLLAACRSSLMPTGQIQSLSSFGSEPTYLWKESNRPLGSGSFEDTFDTQDNINSAFRIKTETLASSGLVQFSFEAQEGY